MLIAGGYGGDAVSDEGEGADIIGIAQAQLSVGIPAGDEEAVAF